MDDEQTFIVVSPDQNGPRRMLSRKATDLPVGDKRHKGPEIVVWIIIIIFLFLFLMSLFYMGYTFSANTFWKCLIPNMIVSFGLVLMVLVGVLIGVKQLSAQGNSGTAWIVILFTLAIPAILVSLQSLLITPCRDLLKETPITM